MLRLFAACLLSSVALAQSYFSAALEGAQEVPPVVTAGRGWGIVRLDPATNTVTIFVFHELLSGAPIAAHLHIGAVGVSGGVILPLAPAGPNTYTGSGVLAAPDVAALNASGTYLNVHTPANPGGEIRGQVVPSVSSRYKGVLTGAQEVPPNPSIGTGTAVAYLHEPENRVVYMVNSTGLVSVAAAHFHQGAPGVSGPIIVPLNGSNGNYCGVSNRLPAAQLAAWKANGCYANIHTAAFPNGEIRAQMLQDVGDHFVAALNGLQEVPPSPSPGLGGASLILGVNGTLSLQGGFSGLTGPPTAAHVHLGPPGVSGGIVFPLAIAGPTISGTYTPTAADLTSLRAGNWYVNIHTVAFGGGEIRGQLGPARLPTTFGEGCQGSSGVRPQIGATGFPSVGSSMSIDLYGAFPGSAALFAFGASRDSAGVIPLPISLGTIGIGGPTCHLFVDPASILAFPINGFGCASVLINVPFAPALRGQNYYSQWFAIDLPGFIASSALSMTIQ
ncbi:MAG TPA: CHRD domain-containing protein [Planctomycetota bacterium]|nr:CHRD domain-containing protein [Planctomycetota bacterium]